jgi:GNAT superfamily N-acetyltransferase
MKIVDATWEKRNLLLETKEIIVQEGDTTEELEEALRNSNEEYVVVKLPLTEIEKKFLLTDYGYTHVELMAELESENVLSPLDARKRMIFDRVETVPMDFEQRKKLVQRFLNGQFKTDRISVDPYFPPEMASRRYAGWLCDEMKHGAAFWQFEMEGEEIGFFVERQISKDVYNAVLSGIYEPYQGQGLGFLVVYKAYSIYRPRGARRFVAEVSVNDLKGLRRTLTSGRKLNKLTNIYVKHNLPKEEYRKRVSEHADTLLSEAVEWCC